MIIDIPLLSYVRKYGKEKTKVLLSDFSCPKNPEAEAFLKENAVNFTEQKISVTYILVNDETMRVEGFYTLALKGTFLSDSVLSGRQKRKAQRFGAYYKDEEGYWIPGYLIAWIARNFKPYESTDRNLNGAEIIDAAEEKIYDSQRLIGGGLVFLECDNHPKLLHFYEENGFRYYNTRITEKGRNCWYWGNLSEHWFRSVKRRDGGIPSAKKSQ